MKNRRLLAYAVFPVMATILWHVMDATPSLWIYDMLVQQPNYNLSEKTVMVTGASSGIGAALVCELANAGARHVILASRRVEKMKDTIEDCQTQSPGSITTTFSVVSYDAEEATQTTVQQAIESAPDQSIDILVLNSGVYLPKLAMDTSAEEQQNTFRINFEAPIALSRAMISLNKWKERGHGHLVVVSSVMAKGPQSLASVYAASKAAVKTYFQTLSTEEFGWLRLNTMLPGATKTNFWISSSEARPDPGTLMSPERVARLMVKAFTGPIFLFYEVSIAKAPALLYVWMSHYTPTLFYFSNHLVAVARIAALKAYNMDMLEIPNLIQTLVKVLLGKLPTDG